MSVAHAKAPTVSIRYEKRLAAPTMKSAVQQRSHGNTHCAKKGARTKGAMSHWWSAVSAFVVCSTDAEPARRGRDDRSEPDAEEEPGQRARLSGCGGYAPRDGAQKRSRGIAGTDEDAA